MSYYAIVMSSQFDYAKSRVVPGDRYELWKENVLFYRDDRLTYQIPAHYLHSVKRFDDRDMARIHLYQAKKKVAQCALRVTERGSYQKRRKSEGHGDGFLDETASVNKFVMIQKD